MSQLDIDITGFTIDLSSTDVVFNQKVAILRPKNCTVSDWEELWKRLETEKHFSHTFSEKDGNVVINLDTIDL